MSKEEAREFLRWFYDQDAEYAQEWADKAHEAIDALFEINQ